MHFFEWFWNGIKNLKYPCIQYYQCFVVDVVIRRGASESSKILTLSVQVVPYTFVRRGVPVREDTLPEPSACEIGWPVPFLAAFISPVFPMGTNLLLGEQ